jgi:hypothetical protein
MLRNFVVVFVLLWLSIPVYGEGVDSRVVRGKVLLPDGKPAAGVVVYLLQAARPSHSYFVTMDGAKNNPRCQFRTNARGEFEIRFAVTRDGDYTKEAAKLGHGVYYLVVLPGAKTSGAVSGPIMNPDAADEDVIFWRKFWDTKLVLGDKPLQINMQIRKGDTLAGRVETTDGKPIAGAKLKIFSRLTFNSHTGNGGEIFEMTTSTNADGLFRFERVFPGHVLIQFPTPGMVWMQTRIGKNGPWQDEHVDQVESSDWVEIRIVQDNYSRSAGASPMPKANRFLGPKCSSAGPITGRRKSAATALRPRPERTPTADTRRRLARHGYHISGLKSRATNRLK